MSGFLNPYRYYPIYKGTGSVLSESSVAGSGFVQNQGYLNSGISTIGGVGTVGHTGTGSIINISTIAGSGYFSRKIGTGALGSTISSISGSGVYTHKDSVGTGSLTSTSSIGGIGGVPISIEYLDPDMWYDASDHNTMYQDSAKTIPVTGDGQPVGCWEDKGLTGADMIQTSSLKKPLIVANSVNGKHILRGDGFSALESSHADWQYSTDQYGKTICIVYKVSSNPLYSTYNSLMGSTGSTYWLYTGILIQHTYTEAMHVGVYDNKNPEPLELVTADDTYPEDIITIFTMRYDHGQSGDDLQLYNNANLIYTGESTGATPYAGPQRYPMQLFAGGNDYYELTGDILEVLVFWWELDERELPGMVQTLKKKWGIA